MKIMQKSVSVGVLKSLSNSIRLDIINVLLQKPCNVSQICWILNKRQPHISQHLKMLKDCGLVNVSVHGKYRIYTINKKYLKLLKQLTNL